MIQMTLQVAETTVRAAQDKAKALGTPMTVTVVDEAGRLVLSARGDGTGFFSPETSRAKAVAAAAFKRPTKELAELAAQGGFWSLVPTVLQGQALPTPGGTPIVRGGQVIGGIGCGGGTGQQDQESSDAGAAAVK
ncbi:MAG: heme-binding protein [Candidatus Rokubacteria bacterium]|nr:heme-binding protein [Candidatus Rokubacteria bacterium]